MSKAPACRAGPSQRYSIYPRALRQGHPAVVQGSGLPGRTVPGPFNLPLSSPSRAPSGCPRLRPAGPDRSRPFDCHPESATGPFNCHPESAAGPFNSPPGSPSRAPSGCPRLRPAGPDRPRAIRFTPELSVKGTQRLSKAPACRAGPSQRYSIYPRALRQGHPAVVQGSGLPGRTVPGPFNLPPSSPSRAPSGCPRLRPTGPDRSRAIRLSPRVRRRRARGLKSLPVQSSRPQGFLDFSPLRYSK